MVDCPAAGNPAHNLYTVFPDIVRIDLRLRALVPSDHDSPVVLPEDQDVSPGETAENIFFEGKIVIRIRRSGLKDGHTLFVLSRYSSASVFHRPLCALQSSASFA